MSQRKGKGAKAASASSPLGTPGSRYGEGAAVATGGLALRDPVTQYVQIQLLQVGPSAMM